MQLLGNLLGGSNDPQSVERSRTTGTKGVHPNSLADRKPFGRAGEDTGERTIQGRSVHVTTSLDAVGRWDNGGIVMSSGDAQEGLLDDLVGVRLGLVEGGDVFGDIGKPGGGGVSEIVLG